MKKSGFLKHHRKIKIEGTDLPGIVNKCIKNGIMLKDLKWKDQLRSEASLKDEDYSGFKDLAGYSYRITTIGEGGIVPFFRTVKNNIMTIIGAFLLGALIFYQSLFIAEIRVDGYVSLPETDIRQTLSDAGIYEGAKKPDDYKHVKAVLYDTHPEITWVSIYEEGRLIKVQLAEAGKAEEAEKEDKTPVHIVASRSGMIEKIMPLQGNAKVKEGDYVNKGDILISGRYRYQSSDYSRGDGYFDMYSHAKGQVMAKVPRCVTFYMQKEERIEELTGKMVPGIFIKIGDVELDTAASLNRFETSVRKEHAVINVIRPLPVSVRIVKICEAVVKKQRVSSKKRLSVTEAAVRQYKREKLLNEEEIVSYDIEFSETENLIIADVYMEVLEDIGEEKKIKIAKEEKSEKDR